jgi:hypothetical protein
MKSFCPTFTLAALLLASCTLAQGQSAADTASTSAERARIETQRQQELTRYAEQEQACAEKFFVNDCLAKIKSQHRETLAQLQRQDIALNDAERRRRVAQQSELAQSKLLPKAASAPGSNDAKAQAEERLQRKTQDKARAQSQNDAAAADRSQAQAQKRKVHSEQDAADAAKAAALAAKNQRLYQDKRAQAAQHKADVQRRQKEKTKPQALPLPDPS